MTAGTALVRRPSPRLADGIVTHIERTPVDLELARRQHDSYRAALAGSGWRVVQVEPADECPDSVFVEDTVVVADGVAVITRPGAPSRRPETAAVATATAALGLTVARIEPPATLDGGDVLEVGRTVFVGLSARTTAAGVEQLAAHLPDRTVVAVPVTRTLHLKSAITALPDGTFLTWGGLVELDPFDPVLEVPEEAGAHVVPLGGDRVLLAASAPRTADLLAGLGYRPVVVDISEYERLEGCVTCLSVLVP